MVFLFSFFCGFFGSFFFFFFPFFFFCGHSPFPTIAVIIEILLFRFFSWFHFLSLFCFTLLRSKSLTPPPLFYSPTHLPQILLQFTSLHIGIFFLDGLSACSWSWDFFCLLWACHFPYFVLIFSFDPVFNFVMPVYCCLIISFPPAEIPFSIEYCFFP